MFYNAVFETALFPPILLGVTIHLGPWPTRTTGRLPFWILGMTRGHIAGSTLVLNPAV